MKFINLRYLIIGIAMLAAAGLAVAITPREKVADQGSKVELETMIPKQFGEWRMDETVVPLQADPKQRQLLDKIYNQTLSRTYINEKGQRVMLSIAYGGDQSDGMSLHRPEVCYPSQGFQLLRQIDGMLNVGKQQIPVRRLVAAQGQRMEPITYWTTIGQLVTVSGTQKKWEQLKFGLTGKIPDGLLFRVSSLSMDYVAAYRTQDTFVRNLLDAVPEVSRYRLIGNPAS